MKTTLEIPPISIKGKEFYDHASRQPFITRGVDLSAANLSDFEGADMLHADILANQNLDFMNNTIIPKLVYLNANMIRVYQVDPSNKHGQVMNALKQNGIYVTVGLVSSQYSVEQMGGGYSRGAFNHAAKTVDEFNDYENTLCFSVRNEVDSPGQQAFDLKAANPHKSNAEIVKINISLKLTVAQAVRSFARDVKDYISSKKYRAIPVGCARQEGPKSLRKHNTPKPSQVGRIGTDIIGQYYAGANSSERIDSTRINMRIFANVNTDFCVA